jgi:hypothetical protein
MKRAALVFVLLVVMASSACAAVSFSIDAIGLIGGSTSLVDSLGGGIYKPVLGPLSATAVTATINDTIALSGAMIGISLDKDYTTTRAESISGYFLSAYLRVAQMGAISHWVGVEFAQEKHENAEIIADSTNFNYRAKAKVLGEVSLLLDVELISNGKCEVDGKSTGTVTTTFDNAKLGVSIPLFSI